MPPTKPQLKLLKYIDKHITKNGVAPDYQQMMKHLKLKSKSGVHRKLKGLEQRGLIETLKYCNRGIKVVDNPYLE